MSSLAEALTLLYAFAEAERTRFSNRRGNMLASAVREIERYLKYLAIAQARIDVLGPAEGSMDLFAPGREAGPLTKEELAQMIASGAQHTELHLYHEAVYLFADILLDRVAGLLSFYFNQARGIGLGSHHDVQRHLVRYAAALGLQAPSDDLLTLVADCQTVIGDLRDDLIAHRQGQRHMTWGTSFSLETFQTRLSAGLLYPREGEEVPGDAAAPEDVLRLVGDYVVEMIGYIRANAEHARLRDREDPD